MTAEPSSSETGWSRAAALEARSLLEGPGSAPEAGEGSAGEAPGEEGGSGPREVPGDGELQAVTGGGLVAILDPARGLRSLWRGEEQVAGPLELPRELGTPGPSPSLTLGPGTWERVAPLEGGGALRERGLLPDAEAVAVVQWTVEGEAGAPVVVALDPRGVHAGAQGAGTVDAGSQGVAAHRAGEGEPGAPERVGRVLRAREVERLSRGTVPGEDDLEIRWDGPSGTELYRSLTTALALLDESPLAVDGKGDPAPPFLGGVENGHPVYLQGSPLAEVGLAALAAGRHALGRSVLRTLAATDPGTAPVPLLFLAARWTAWTGEPGFLLELEGALERAAVEALALHGDPAPGAAFPTPLRALELLADGMEPLGLERWTRGLRDRIRGVRRDGEGTPETPRKVSLPVLGAGATAAAPDDPGLETDPVLPPPESFGPPDLPGHQPRRTLRGARLVRAWIEGTLGALPDAAWGRLTLAPTVPDDLESFQLRGLRVGDARIRLDCRRDGPTLSFLLRQESGRLPVNLVFQPRLPFPGVERVLIGDDPADVEVVREGSGTALRCQFPLDPERRMTIVQAT